MLSQNLNISEKHSFHQLSILPITRYTPAIQRRHMDNPACFPLLNRPKQRVALQIYGHNLAMLFVVFEVTDTHLLPRNNQYPPPIWLTILINLALIYVTTAILQLKPRQKFSILVEVIWGRLAKPHNRLLLKGFDGLWCQ